MSCIAISEIPLEGVMDDTAVNNVYKLYNHEEDTTRNTFCSGLLSCLYTYTIGSCLYFKDDADASSVTDEEEIELKPMVSSDQKSDNGANMEEGRNSTSNDSEWKKAECKMKKRIKHHFTDHIRRWITERRFPWRVILHLLLVALVTTQVSLYAVDRTKLTKFLIESTDAINQYFRSVNHNGEIVLYRINDVYDQIEHIVEYYYSLPDQFLAVSSICYHNNKNKPEILNMSVKYLEIQNCTECGQNLSGTFPDTTMSYDNVSRGIFLPTTADPLTNESETTACDNNNTCCTSDQCDHSIRDQVKYFVNMNNLYRISQVSFKFTLETTYQKGVIEDYNAVEVEFRVDIRLNGPKHLHSSHIDVEVVVEPLLKRLCDGSLRARNTVIDSIVIVLAMLALIGYSLSVSRSIRLAKDVKLHFLVYHKKKLGWEEINILFNKFYILMLFTCFLLIVTSILKIISEYIDKIHLRLIEDVSILLGIGVFLLWCGLFGLLKYFESLNVLLITLKLAVPSVLRFAVCMAILFLAFTFCGWLIIGPYNPQFDNPWIAAETLISIVNGDGIADAFSATSSDSVVNSVRIVIISKLYLILFVFIFIYIVLSLFIGIFNHAYDSLSANWRSRSRGFLWDWAEEQEEDDLTKNYPFPVPRIRDLSSELRIECCKWHSHLASMTKKKSRKVTAVGNPAPLQSFTTASDDGDYTSSDENTRKERKSLVNFFSDSKLQPPGHVQPPRHEHVYYSVRNPRRYRGTTRFSSRRHRSSVKSIVKEPPDASQQEIAKAKCKLLHKSQHLEMNMLEEDDL